MWRIIICILFTSFISCKNQCDNTQIVADEFVTWFKANYNHKNTFVVDHVLSNSILSRKVLKRTLLEYAPDIDISNLLEMNDVPIGQSKNQDFKIVDMKDFRLQPDYKWHEQNEIQLSLPIQPNYKNEFL